MTLVAFIEAPVDAVRLEYTVPAGGAKVTFSRVGPSGTPATVRSWLDVPVTPGPVIARDFEAPIGVPVTYTAQTMNSGGTVINTQTVAITIASVGCSDTWLTDIARSQNTMRVLIEQLPELEYPVMATVHDVIGRRAPIVSSDIAGTPAFEVSVLTETLNDREIVRAILGNGVPVLLRTPPEHGIGNLYFSVLGFKEQRIVTAGTVPDRRFVIEGRQVQRPDAGLYAPVGPFVYQELEATYATYADLKANRANYDAVLYDWAGSMPSDLVPWPPEDV